MKEVIAKFMEKLEKNIVITDSGFNVIYQSEKTDFPAETIIQKIKNTPEDMEEWEYYDKALNIYLLVKRIVINHEGKDYICFHFTDVSEYTMLTKDVLAYSKSVQDMSRFQSGIMKRLSMSYDAFLPGLYDYFGAKETVMYIITGLSAMKSVYNGSFRRYKPDDPDEINRVFAAERGDVIDGYTCLMNSSIQDKRYVVLVHEPSGTANDKVMSVSVHNVITLFIENSILREKIVYESEHDKLTGLYNKGKYMALKKEGFGKPGSVAVFNFDVNNLKYINDTFGHEYGDRLIIKAARSIGLVSTDNVLGFRTGGDEYVMVALDISEERANEIYSQWTAALKSLNASDDGLYCAMACGMTFGSGDFDYDALFRKADELMYINKKELKKNNIGSHLTKEDEGQ